MMYKAKVAVCSDIRTKHSTQSERHVEFLNVKPGGTKKPLGVKRLIFILENLVVHELMRKNMVQPDTTPDNKMLRTEDAHCMLDN